MHLAKLLRLDEIASAVAVYIIERRHIMKMNDGGAFHCHEKSTRMRGRPLHAPQPRQAKNRAIGTTSP
jgi:hypothetical protein